MSREASREQTIKQLFEIRDSAVADINNSTVRKIDSKWLDDRARDIEWANRQLVRLGAIPAMA